MIERWCVFACLFQKLHANSCVEVGMQFLNGVDKAKRAENSTVKNHKPLLQKAQQWVTKQGTIKTTCCFGLTKCITICVE